MTRSFRIAALPQLIPAVEKLLRAESYDFAPEPFSPFCRRLVTEPVPLGSSLAAFFGYIYIQDRSSMLPPLALNPEPGSIVLDMAASPGGKTGLLAQLAGPAGLVIANEPNPARLATLRANLQRASLPQAITCSYPGESLSLPPAGISRILLDPPCSGWGTTAKNPRAAKIWQGAKIDRLATLQRRLLTHAASLLAPGGSLLYSTCTTNPEENEAQTVFAKTELGLEPTPLTQFPGFTFQQTQNGALLVDGAASQAQGFYLSLLRKPSQATAPAAHIASDFPYSMSRLTLSNFNRNVPSISPAKRGLPVHSARTSAHAAVIERSIFNGDKLYLPKTALAGPLFDPALLPPGQTAVFGDLVRFLPAQCGMLASMRWQGLLLGKWSNASFTPAPRLRICMPKPDKDNTVIFETIEPIRRLLAGQQIQSGLAAPHVALWWQDLPLGTCQNRSGRLICPFR